ncbi:MAG: hypothetical protein KF745_12035 [Phycisphaeraceae bacterium]|nr:hypothetical protein [Phycisphaeraceae bacterium]
MSRRAGRSIVLGALLCAIPAAAQVEPRMPADGSAAGRFVVIERSGSRPSAATQGEITLTRFLGDAIRYTDERGIERERRFDGMLALAPWWWTSLDQSSGSPARLESRPVSPDAPAVAPDLALGAVLDLVDGQRLTGLPAALAGGRLGDAAPAGGDAIAWDHPRSGRLHISLDDVKSLRIEWTDEREPAAGDESRGSDAETTDEVVLRNGDRLRGLIETIGRSVVVASGPGNTDRTSVTIDRVRSLRLANPARPPKGTVVWLRDGSVLQVASLESGTGGGPAGSAGAGQVVARLGAAAGAAGPSSWPLAEMTAVLIDADRLVSLSALSIASQDTAGRRRAPKARISAAAGDELWAKDVQLRGPMTVEWSLPAGSTRLLGDLAMPSAAWAWGDCEVSISSLGPDGAPVELIRVRLNADRPAEHVDLSLPQSSGAALRIRVEPGANGPIQDWVDLKRMLIEIGAK